MPEDAHTSRGRVSKPKRTRVNFSAKQLETMDKVFSQTQYPDVTVLEALAKRMDLGIEKVCTWFQNRRSKFRRESKKGHIDWMRQQLFTGSGPAGTDPDQGVVGELVSGQPVSGRPLERASPEHVLSDVQTLGPGVATRTSPGVATATSPNVATTLSDADESVDDNRVSPHRTDSIPLPHQMSARSDCFSKNDYLPLTITPTYPAYTTPYSTYNTSPVTNTSSNAPCRTTYYGDYTNAPYVTDASWSCGQYSAQHQSYPDSYMQQSAMTGNMASYMTPTNQYDSRFYNNQSSAYQYSAL